jgi:hypothetical protein
VRETPGRTATARLHRVHPGSESSPGKPHAVPAHTQRRFTLTLRLPLRRAARLFGPGNERTWAGKGWNPQFLYPLSEKDVEGAVFMVRAGAHTSVWVTTRFDVAGGRIQYASFVPDLVASTVDFRLTPANRSTTRVEVTYSRTSLSVSANREVEEMGQHDRGRGAHWQRAIELFLKGSFHRAELVRAPP